MLTHVSQSFQDNLGLLVFSHTVHRYLPLSKGRAQYAQFLQALYGLKPELSHVNYHGASEYLVARHPKRALTMVFTDLLDTVVSSVYRDAVRLLRQFHLPLTLTVVDAPQQSLAARTQESPEELSDVKVDARQAGMAVPPIAAVGRRAPEEKSATLGEPIPGVKRLRSHIPGQGARLH